MKAFYLTVFFLLNQLTSVHAQETDLFYLFGTRLVNDSPSLYLTHNLTAFAPLNARKASIWQSPEKAKAVLFTTRKGKPVEVYFFPGLSNKNALVVGGMHGSELSAIEVAKTLVKGLSTGEKPYYNVVIIPSLFPDNAQEAIEAQDRLLANAGRYTDASTADPNRQMPLLGKPFLREKPLDALHREIEGENAALLQLIQTYRPHRLINIHAIRDKSKAGIFADPRTDCSGYALGYDTDKALAVLMAQHIQENGGTAPGNNLQEEPTALYHLDPPIVAEGQKQQRSFNGSNIPGRGQGVSLGAWASTAVCDNTPGLSRPAIRTFTMEFPGYQTSTEFQAEQDRLKFEKAVSAYAAAIQHYFLQSFFIEETGNDGRRFASNY